MSFQIIKSLSILLKLNNLFPLHNFIEMFFIRALQYSTIDHVNIVHKNTVHYNIEIALIKPVNIFQVVIQESSYCLSFAKCEYRKKNASVVKHGLFYDSQQIFSIRYCHVSGHSSIGRRICRLAYKDITFYRNILHSQIWC